jgi:glycosyltransferase involved in cell wall biosynthesis
MKTLLFITAGPYFWPHQKASTAKYEWLSKHADGFILSFVCAKAWRRVQINNFQLIGFYINDRTTYNSFVLRTIARIVFVLITSLYLHYFRKRLDAIITWDPFLTGMLGYIVSKLTGAKLIVEVNGDYADPQNWEMHKFNLLTYLKIQYIRRAVPFILNRAHAVKLLYPTQVDCFQGLTHTEHYRCFHDLVPISLYGPGTGTSPYILFIGHPWHRKGVDVLIKAFNQVSPEFPEWVLKVIGHLPEREQFRFMYEHNTQIQFPGPVMPEKVPSLLSQCSLFVLPSRSEGMPRVLFEAMASRKPIITSRVSGIPYYMKHEDTALLFDSEDVNGLALAMRTLISDRKLADRLANNGYRYVWMHLSEELHVRQFMRMIDEITM